MSHLFKNINISFRLEMVPFLRHLASKDRGGISRYIRGLIEADPTYLDWLQAHQKP